MKLYQIGEGSNVKIQISEEYANIYNEIVNKKNSPDKEAFSKVWDDPNYIEVYTIVTTLIGKSVSKLHIDGVEPITNGQQLIEIQEDISNETNNSEKEEN